ncbi:Uncharacterised protein [Klebsiella variicola]|nr:Uncharacterised protein [Klebsiella variicola]
MTDKIRQLRRRCPCQRPGDITARQSLQRCRGCLDTPLQVTAGSVCSHRGTTRLARNLFCRRTAVTLCLQLRFRRRQGCGVFYRLLFCYLALRARNICRLAANLPCQLHFLQAPLLLLLVKYRPDTAAGMLRIATQVSHVLLLAGLVTDDDSALGYRRLRRTFRMAFAAAPRQQGAGHVPGELRANAAPGADTAALMLRLIIRLVVDIAETQRAGIEAVFICASCGSNHPAIQLRVAAHSDIKAALTGKYPALLLHRRPATGHFVATGIQASRPRPGAEGVTQATAEAALRAVVMVAVPQAGYRQVTADISGHLVTADLCAGQRGIPSAADDDLMTGIHRRFILPGAVAALMPFAAAGVCRDADTGSAGAHPHADANTAAAAFVAAGSLLCVL